ncbi:MAG: GNAT family N-acetyltransferase [Pseudomonadota bacterium]
MQLSVRALRADELAWANARYAEIDFLASAPDDYVAVADIAGVPAGLGRVTRLGGDAGELGGMYVFDGFRARGVSGAMLAHLLAHAGVARLYCLPFAHLRRLYEKAGFTLDLGAAAVPDQVRRKHAWCMGHYAEPVLLMYRPLTQPVTATTTS